MRRPQQVCFTLRNALAALALTAAPLLTGCAAHSYAGISFAPGAADPELQILARRAQAGDKHAQLELGIRYEEGRGVAVDLKRAVRLYRLAASDSGGPVQVYSPPVGRNGQGRVIAVGSTARLEGLPEAAARLHHLIVQKGNET